MLGSAEARRAAIYRQLAALEEAGIPLRSAVDRLVEPALTPVASGLQQGLTPGEAWALSPRFSKLEVSLVRAGAKSGQLAEAFRSLEQLFEERAKTRRELAVGLAYPLLLLHLAILIPNAPALILTGPGAYARATLVPIACAYAVLFLLVVAFKAARKAAPAPVDALVARVPVLGGIAWRSALSHGLQSFIAVYRAGVPVNEAVEDAARSASLHGVEAAFRRVGSRLDNGATIGDAFFQETTFPVDVREAAATGSVTGKLEEQLAGARRRLDGESQTKKRLLVVLGPVLVYFGVAAGIAWTVISFYSGYFKQIEDLSK